MGGWSILYDNPSEAVFADILGIDERMADNIINATKQQSNSDNKDSIYSQFSCVHACIVGNDTVKFNREGKLLSNEELAVEEALGTSTYDLNRWSEISLSSPIFDSSKLMQSQREWCDNLIKGSGSWGSDAPLARVDDDDVIKDVWGPDALIVNPS